MTTTTHALTRSQHDHYRRLRREGWRAVEALRHVRDDMTDLANHLLREAAEIAEINRGRA